MTAPPIYCIDSSSLIGAWVRHYPPKAFPGVWVKFEELIAVGRLRAPDEVGNEIEKKEDDLKKWAKSQNSLFVPLDFTQATEVKRILTAFPLLVDSSRGRSGGDPFVIALAKLHNHTVVTQEARTNSPKKPRIPDVCEYYRIPYLTVLEMILREGWTF